MRVVWLLAASLFFTSVAAASEPLECLIEPHQLVDISSSELGLLASVHVEKADIVKKGDVLAKLHDEIELIDFLVSRTRADAKADLELLTSDLEYNTRIWNRADHLNKNRALSAQDVDEIFTQKDAARLRLQAANERQEIALLEAVRNEIVLARRTVRSPIDGVVVRRHKNPGEYVEADSIMQLAQLDPLRIEVVLPMLMYGKVIKGMTATVIPELPLDGPFIATVVSVDPVMDAATATFGVTLTLPNPDLRLPAGLKCLLTLQSEHVNSADRKSPTNAHESLTAADRGTINSSLKEPELAASSTGKLETNGQSEDPSVRPPDTKSNPDQLTAQKSFSSESECKDHDKNTHRIAAENHTGDESTEKSQKTYPGGQSDCVRPAGE